MPDTTGSPQLPQHVSVLVVGAGFGGLAMAIKLDEAGRDDFLVVERGSDVGGTWRDNTYPGAACDVPSQLYSYSFALNPQWSSSFSPQPEIQAYIKKVADSSGTLDRFAFDTSLEAATWDATAGHWKVRTSAGELTADAVVSAAGALSDPKNPDIEGFDSFDGEVFHSARWNHDQDLTGKRVAIIGTGASSIQIVPEIAEKVAHLDVYQRTAPWVVPRNDRPYTGVEKVGFKVLPGLQRLYRTAIYWGREMYVPAFTKNPKLAWPAQQLALLNIKRGIDDPELRAKVTPDYTIGCKRILISNTWYPALNRDNVDLVTEGIARVTPRGIVTTDGQEREVDVIIVATGFHTTDLPIAGEAHRPRRHAPRRALRRARHAGLQGHHRARVPEPVLRGRTQHRSGPLEHGVHDRVPGRLHHRRAVPPRPAQPTPRGGGPRADRRGAARPTSTASRRRWRAPSGAPEGAPAGTSTPTDATSPCGPAPRSRSAA